MSASSFTTKSMSDSSHSSKELCVICQTQPYDLICTCGDKFDFTCIHSHVEQIGLEFQFVQNEVGERLLQVEQIIEDNNCTNPKTIIENWKRKRIQDINDIADDALHQIEEREKVYSEVTPFRVHYHSLCHESHRVVHEQLSSIVVLQRQVLEKLDELETLPKLLHDDLNLDSKIQSKLNPNIFNQNSSLHEIEPISSLPVMTTTDTNEQITTEPIISAPTTISNTNILMSTEPTISIPTTPLNENPSINVELTAQLTNSVNENNSTAVSVDHDEFEAGQTANIQRQNAIIIATNNDRFVATICSNKNQLFYNDYNQRTRKARLTLIPDITQPTDKQIIDWAAPEAIVGGGDDEWIQDIAYSTKLEAYLLLNRSRLRLFHPDTREIEEFYQFPDRSMKRVTCNDQFIYLIIASGITAQNGDEIILMNYDKEEKILKTFRDIVLHRNNRITGPIVGEISDLAVNTTGQIIISYRLERRQEVGVCIYNISNHGNDWKPVKQLLLNECWHNDLSYTPRIEWCEKLNVFILIEYMTSHLIMLDQTGQVQGESRFTHVENRHDAPLNLTVSNNDWLCIRYESSINIYRLEDDRF